MAMQWTKKVSMQYEGVTVIPKRKPLVPDSLYDLSKDIAWHRALSFTCLESEIKDFFLLGFAGFYAAKDENSKPCIVCCDCLVTGDVQAWRDIDVSTAQGEHQYFCPNRSLSPREKFNKACASTEDKFECKRLLLLLINKNNFATGGSLDTFIKMAQNGFHFGARPDTTLCFSCKVEIRGWQENDDPKQTHEESSPQCCFLQNETTSGNVAIGSEYFRGLGQDSCAFNKDQVEGAGCSTSKYPDFDDEEVRKDTFKRESSWAEMDEGSVLEMAKSGLFSIGPHQAMFHCCGLALEIHQKSITSEMISTLHEENSKVLA